MAEKISSSKYDLIQETIANPEFKSKLSNILKEMSANDLASLIQNSPPQERKIIWDSIELEYEGEVLGELDEQLRDELLKEMEPEEISLAISDLEVDDLVDILQALPEKITNDVLALMNSRDRGRIENVIDFPEESAGGLMNTDIITVRAENTIELVSRYLRFLKNLPQNTDDIYVVTKNDEYLGILPITKILTSDQNMTVREVMDTEFEPISSELNQVDVYDLFKAKDLFSAPVVNDKNQLLGRITVDDIIEIGADAVQEDFRALAQIEEDVFSSPKKSIKNRIFWLSINLLTAIIAAASISLFADVFEKVVYAAVLMPIVASMGGIAATQTLGIYIRAEAMRKLNRKNFRYLFRREFIVSIVNGIFFSISIFGITFFWFSDYNLAIAISIAMILNLIMAAVGGFLLPYILRKIGYDPAISGGVIITTITDLIGFVTFLGIVSFLVV
ncbi:MAG: magnesium transporter [SAR86 cluster bacterium]|jgi:magnesium transporter|nr:MAG: magnesium transporter [SAR86 cluster bacterium]|tara:strand:- start:1889 stop:3232 length:1344 start_codon:yes stop_codon:yes gene_type:complete